MTQDELGAWAFCRKGGGEGTQANLHVNEGAWGGTLESFTEPKDAGPVAAKTNTHLTVCTASEQPTAFSRLCP